MIRGIGTSKGIGIGHALIIDEPQIEAKTEIVSDTAAELRRYENVKKKFIADTRMENVAQRVILNRCDVQIQPILQGLDLMDRIDYQYAHIVYVPQLVQCALVHTAPDVLTSVKEAFREVSESC